MVKQRLNKGWTTSAHKTIIRLPTSSAKHPLRNTFDPCCVVHRAARLNAIVHDQKQQRSTMLLMISPQRASRETEIDAECAWNATVVNTREATQCTKTRRGLMRRFAMRVVTSLPANQKSSTLRSATVLEHVKQRSHASTNDRRPLDF